MSSDFVKDFQLTLDDSLKSEVLRYSELLPRLKEFAESGALVHTLKVLPKQHSYEILWYPATRLSRTGNPGTGQRELNV